MPRLGLGLGLANTQGPLGSGAAALLSIVVTPANFDLALGLAQQMVATGHYSNGTTSDITNLVTWVSTDEAVALVDSGGLVSSVTEGPTTIEASLNGITGSTPLTVVPPVLLSITVTPENATYPTGIDVQYTATGQYSDGPDVDLTAVATWATTDNNIAGVDSSGLVTMVDPGTVDISATFDSVLGSTPLTVTVPALVSIVVTPANATVALGLTQQMVATGHYNNGTTAVITGSVTWGSTIPGFATISVGGLVTTVAQGTTSITAVLGLVSGNTPFTTGPAALVSIAVTPVSPSVALGLTQQMTATGTYTDSTTADVTATSTWGSTDMTKATVSIAGLVTTVAQGVTTISATIGIISGSQPFTVAAPTLLSIAVTPANPSITIGQTQQMVATGTYTNGLLVITGSVTWASVTPARATISAGGLVTAVSYGTTSITATLSAVVGSTTASVVMPVFNFGALTPGAVTLPAGLTFARASIATVQTGTSTVITTGIGNNVARVGRRLTGDTPGLVIERTATNAIADSRNTTVASWQPGSVADVRPGAAPSPDGSTTQNSSTTTGAAQFSRYVQFAATTGVAVVLSMWSLSTSGASITGTWQVGTPNQTYSATSAWVRAVGLYTTAGSAYFLAPCNTTAQAITHDMHQHELGLIATEFITTSGGAATRQGEQLTCSYDLRASAGLELRLEFVVRPKGSSTQYPALMTLWFQDASNNIRINNTTGAVNILIGGVTYTTATAASWAAADTVSFWVVIGNGVPCVVKYRIGAGSAVTLSTGSPTSFASVPAPPYDLLSSGTNLQFTTYAVTIMPYGTGLQPAWV